ncbi:hypothetical protein ACJIZ3_009735 [Penstemon smallii]|uniref:RBR-type E3 ubiquitin transferase n=1 Tax=Penstemon smallii TaxID=265156 RepID=A0ABD3TDC2_9LAMI
MGNTLQTPPQIPPPQHQEQDLQENELDNKEFTCEICIEIISNPDNKFKNANKCSHPFCINCIIKYIHVKLEDDNVGHIKCPALNCDHALEPVACAQLIDTPLFLRWNDMLCEEMIFECDTCYCPYEKCNVLIVNECGEDQKKSECPSCKRWFCFQCRKVWHAGFECAESEELKDEDEVAFGRLAEEKKWIRCPRCRHFVEHISGCRNVKCRCKSRFCFKCGMDLKSSGRCRCYTTSSWSFRELLIESFIFTSLIIFTSCMTYFSLKIIADVQQQKRMLQNVE